MQKRLLLQTQLYVLKWRKGKFCVRCCTKWKSPRSIEWRWLVISAWVL